MLDNKEYRKTLNLPQTEFSMRAGLSQKEPAYLERWQKEGLYRKLRQKAKAASKKYILHDGPPYANGNIHIGHALNKILKDFVVKYKTMAGFDSHYVPGWDCHGLPIEHQLFKELKKHKSEVDCVDFRKKAHDYAMKYVEIQKEQFKRLGVFGDWDNPYLTLSPEYEYWILKSLAALVRKGFIYRGLKPVNWCAHCETALAEAEVEYDNHTSPSIYVKFPVSTPEILPVGTADKPVFLLIWTTTPWTLLANVAVAVQDNYTYALVDTGEEILVVEESLVEKVMEAAQISGYKIAGRIDGKVLTQLRYGHPFGLQSNCPVVAVDYVTKEEGTGLVHTAPGHGQEDFETGQKYQLETIMPVDNRGRFTERGGPFAGLPVFKANPKIVQALQDQGILLHAETITHSYPHCWRCKNPIIFRATEQWFINIGHQGLRGRLKDVIKNDVVWIPASGQERIQSMVATRPDWCLSRQRYWGVPIPALKLKNGQHKLYPEVIDHFAETVRREGTNAWFTKDIKDLLPPGFKDPETGADTFEKTCDILDVWFDSGVSHQAVIKAMMGCDLPVDLYLEGSDQHRGWFQSSLIPSIALEDKPPYKAVLTHGFVMDGQGRKMSKSLGNVISPLDVVQQSGADILRLWVAASNYNEDIRISKEILDRLVDGYRKIRNTLRYLLGNLNGFDPQTDSLDYEQCHLIDRWALHRLGELTRGVTEAFEKYNFMNVYRQLYEFCNTDMSSIYLDIIKDRLYTSPSGCPDQRAAQTVLYQILNVMVRLLAPVLSFTAEEVFEHMPKAKELATAQSVHLLDWPTVDESWSGPDARQAAEQLERLLNDIRPKVLKALEEHRQQGTIGASLDAKVVLKAGGKEFEYLKTFERQLPTFFIVSQTVLEHTPSGLTIEVQKAEGKKCQRCWNYRPDVGKNNEHPALCGRCLEAIKE